MGQEFQVLVVKDFHLQIEASHVYICITVWKLEKFFAVQIFLQVHSSDTDFDKMPFE